MLTDIKMYNFPLQKDIDGEILSLSVDESYTTYRYSLMYRTTDFDIRTESYYNCRHAG